MTRQKPLFSIVIPAYNYAATLPRAVESVLMQDGDDYEVLIINDGSTDNTEQVLEQLHKIYPDRFRSVLRSNSGPAATRNYGVKHTSGQWLIFLDSDDELEAKALVHLRAAIQKHPAARIVVGGHTSVAEDGRCRYRRIDAERNARLSAEDLFTGYLLHKSVTPSNGATAMHRELFDKVLYPENFRNSEDIPVFAYAFANFPSAFIEQPINRVYKHGDSLRHNISYAHAVGATLIDAVFDQRVIPEYLQKYRNAFAGQRCLSLFRTLYIAGERTEALSYYRMAIKSYWPAVFNFSYTRKALKCYFSN